MDQIQQAIEPCKEFCKDSVRLVKKCTKPDRKGLYLFISFYSFRTLLAFNTVTKKYGGCVVSSIWKGNGVYTVYPLISVPSAYLISKL